jgi:hypothetical protein
LHVHGRWLYGVWCLGNNYKGSGFYGAFPPGFLKRVWALFPDIDGRVLHVCSGSLTKRQVRHGRLPVVRLDARRTRRVRPDVRADAQTLPFRDHAFQLVIADPPYGAAQAAHYQHPMPSRRRMLQQAALIVGPGGHLAWLDTQLPMYRKAEWHNWGQIAVVRSTNHVVRLLSLYERLNKTSQISLDIID